MSIAGNGTATTVTPPTKRTGVLRAVIIVVAVIVVAVGAYLLITSMTEDSEGVDSGATAELSGADADDVAEADVANIGILIATAALEGDEAPEFVIDGDSWTITGGDVFEETGTLYEGIEFGGWSATSAQDWCVWVTAPTGTVKDHQYSAEGALTSGNCA